MRSLFRPEVCRFVNGIRPFGITSCGSGCPGVRDSRVFPPARHSRPVLEDRTLATPLLLQGEGEGERAKGRGNGERKGKKGRGMGQVEGEVGMGRE